MNKKPYFRLDSARASTEAFRTGIFGLRSLQPLLSTCTQKLFYGQKNGILICLRNEITSFWVPQAYL